MNTNKSWNSEQYHPIAHWNELEGAVKIIRSELSKDDFKRYFTVLYKFTSGVYLFHTLKHELAWLPTASQDANETLLTRVRNCCSLVENTFDDGEGDLPDRLLPHPGSINARFLLHCLEHKLPCPEEDFGLRINRTLRESLYDLIEMALRMKLPLKVAENAFLKNYMTVNGKKTVLNSRDFFDSLSFNDDLQEQVENSEPLSIFYDKMCRLSTFRNKAD